MIGGRVGNLALFVAQLANNERKLRAAAQARAEEEAKRAVEAMQEQIPARSGTARASIRWEALPDQAGARVLAGGPETTRADYDYIRAIEFGRLPSSTGPGQRPQPFFGPVAFETEMDGAERIGRGISQDMKD
ncbi:MAG: hypothetical protein K2X71_21405 [Methylobacterium sp.]|uniref:hypothetical protein n=1 Tax=Methylobacterium sp. TaxID=409 RepID=UPI0025888A11|nr:hypothetical protein [Methylobacterium sp.]MBY0298562.1 hypothetical protein [Methylobacterium sp.]